MIRVVLIVFGVAIAGVAVAGQACAFSGVYATSDSVLAVAMTPDIAVLFWPVFALGAGLVIWGLRRS
ncbi:hypothetical protein [Paracoccus sp. (in: a-proteobacteria)]|uniref:hypothetical protein n=1 Tax=Paracoccus sp. TaxID=267 RepID=UPI0026DF3C45|nr:hypothetical protein [Paracoccus sp. (in: a-proteobacteria)]MDO5646683.1 hypothetical protein [Paracoccus sp. (in: a-proteobacteria)]